MNDFLIILFYGAFYWLTVVLSTMLVQLAPVRRRTLSGETADQPDIISQTAFGYWRFGFY